MILIYCKFDFEKEKYETYISNKNNNINCGETLFSNPYKKITEQFFFKTLFLKVMGLSTQHNTVCALSLAKGFRKCK